MNENEMSAQNVCPCYVGEKRKRHTTLYNDDFDTKMIIIMITTLLYKSAVV